MRIAAYTPLFPLSRRALVRFCVAASALSFMSCGDDQVTGPAGVASVVVTGVPITPVIIGDSLQLVATAINVTGGIVSNQAFVWRTSDAGVAVVSSKGRVRAIGAGPVTITASTGGKEGSAALRAWGGGPVGTAGATLTMGNGSGSATLTIPPFAGPQTGIVLLAPASSAPPSSRLVAGTAIGLGPGGLQVSPVGAMTPGYGPAKVPAGAGGESLSVVRGKGPGGRHRQDHRAVRGLGEDQGDERGQVRLDYDHVARASRRRLEQRDGMGDVSGQSESHRVRRRHRGSGGVRPGVDRDDRECGRVEPGNGGGRVGVLLREPVFLDTSAAGGRRATQ